MLLMENSLIISCKKVVNINEGWMIKGEILLDTVKLFFLIWLKGLEQLVEIRHGWIYKYFTVSSHLNFMAQDFIERKTITTFWNINFASFAPCMKYASPLLNNHDKRVLRGGRSRQGRISKPLCIASYGRLAPCAAKPYYWFAQSFFDSNRNFFLLWHPL